MDVPVRHRNGQRAVAGVAGICLLLGVSGLSPAVATESPSTTPTGAVRAMALMNWHVAPSLAALRSEINARWPGRDRTSDGTIGDLRHQARSNSHNPVGHPGGPLFGTRGAVHAMDITARGIDVDAVLSAVIGDPRVWYVIHDGRIWSRTSGWAARTQSGDPHSTHIHINLREDTPAAAIAAETDMRRWLGSATGSGRGSSAATGRSTSTSTASLSKADTVTLQRALIARGHRIPSGPTGWYGPETTKAVRAFQQAQGWSGSDADGIAGLETLRRLGLGSAEVAVVQQVTSPSRTTTAAAPTPAKPTSSTSSSAGLKAYTPGTASREVYFLQQALIERGYAIPAGPTGYYGTKTVEAVKRFQLDQGWPASQSDGIPGTATLKLLGLR
jgi:peptidoglycan hydrolase-like protein with peptidoglycan-binding domain